MHTEIRIALVLLASALAALAAWFLRSAVVDNLVMLRSWTRAEGLVTYTGGHEVQIELGTDPDTRRVMIATDHQLGLSALKKAPVYVDPADPAHVRPGGALQMWLRPAVLVLLAVFFLGCALTAARLGRTGGESGYGAGHWMLSESPPPLETELRVHRPASEWRAPLFWSLLGVAMAACGLFARSGAPLPRLGAIFLGGLWVLLMSGLSLHNGTTEVAADAHGIRETSAFGWRDIPWEEVAGVETREVVAVNRRAFSLTDNLPIPGRTSRSLVFADRSGRALMRLSVAMQPRDTMRRLLDFCAARTGLHEQLRRIVVPDI
ncbi:MAG: resistance to Congo red protein [Bryobacteraceae bacterium]|jgi:hypothetical protein